MILADADPVAVPAGDPTALRAAASTLSASAEAQDSAAATVAAVAGTAVPPAWTGTAASSCAGAEERAVADCRALVRAMREAAAAVAQLAAELAEAVDDARRAAGQAADLAAAQRRLDHVAVVASPSDLPSLQRRADRLASEATGIQHRSAAAAERARLANLAAAAAFDQVTASLPQVATLTADCPPTTRAATRSAIDAQLAVLLGRPLTVTESPEDPDATLPESVFGLGMLLAGGGVVINPAKKKGKGKRGGQAGRATSGAGGPSGGKPPKDEGQKQRVMPGPVWTADEAKAKAREMGWTKTNYLSGSSDE
ncbi:MAG TPA: hypothetical protein VF486_28795, partial [Actinomycetes bacterium]